jgi:hypothetical protein
LLPLLPCCNKDDLKLFFLQPLCCCYPSPGLNQIETLPLSLF